MHSRVLVTGHLGYLGSVFAPRFAAAGHSVTGLDSGYYEDRLLYAPEAEGPAIGAIRKDIRDVEAADLEGYDAVVHLAALSNDPVGNLDPRWTAEINTAAAARLAWLAREAGVSRFLFSSSCIMYGSPAAPEVDEDSPVDPGTAYARSKVEAEREIARLATARFSPVFLRNGTIYGPSPRMRFDTVANQLTAAALAVGTASIHGDGSPWRPVVHIEDAAAAFLAALEAPREALHCQAVNAGSDSDNRTVREIAGLAAAAVGARVETLALPDADRRSYRTRFAKIGRLLPGFRPRFTLEEGIPALARTLAGRLGGSIRSRFEGGEFVRLRALGALLESGRLDATLRFRQARREAA